MRPTLKKLTIFSIVALMIVGFLSVNTQLARAEDNRIVEHASGLCTDTVGIVLSEADFETDTNGENASFKLDLTVGYFETLREIIIIPDSQSDVGNGAGNERVIKVGSADGTYFLDGKYNHPPIQARAVDDGDDKNEHQSTIRFAIHCTGPNAEQWYHFCTVMDIRVSYDGVTSEDANAGFRNSCSSEQASQSKQSITAPSVDDTSAPDGHVYLLNDSKEYTSGKGETVWLKPNEAVRFFIGKENEEHTITVNTLTDSNVTITVASEPTTVTLAKDALQKLDVNNDGQHDISIKFVGILDGQAGLEVKPLTEEARAAATSTDSRTSQQGNSKKSPWLVYAVAAIVVLGGAIAFLAYKGILGRAWRALKARVSSDDAGNGDKKAKD